MAQLKNTLEVFKLLPKTNCKKCNEPTCLVFAANVFKGQRQLAECPYVEKDVISQYNEGVAKPLDMGVSGEESMAQMQQQIAGIDLAEVAERLGARFSGGKLTLKVLGKDFSVDHNGNLFSDIHIHTWVAIPVLDYIIKGVGTPPSGKWVPLRELKGGKNWYRLFGQSCEKPLKRVADIYTDLFEDMIHLFSGRQVQDHYEADISLVLLPLPKLPILICYLRPEEGLESDLKLFFDDTAEENLSIESIYTLGAGLTRMFEKLALRHGFK